MSQSLPLPASLDTAAAGALRVTLKGVLERGEPLLLDGGEVRRAGLACLQVLAAAQAAAAATGLTFAIQGASEVFDDMVRLAGFDAALTRG